MENKSEQFHFSNVFTLRLCVALGMRYDVCTLENKTGKYIVCTWNVVSDVCRWFELGENGRWDDRNISVRLRGKGGASRTCVPRPGRGRVMCVWTSTPHMEKPSPH